VNDDINKIAENVKNAGSNAISFSLDSRMEAKDFVLKSCKVLDSKKLPLWLVMSSASTLPDEDQEQRKRKNIIIIFKNGDDIRQDLLTLQLIKIMDKIW